MPNIVASASAPLPPLPALGRARGQRVQAGLVRLLGLGLAPLILIGGLLPAAAAVAATATATTATATAPSTPAVPASPPPLVRVGSKRFTESYILGEILVQSITRGGGRAEHRQGLGETAIVLGALESGNIDIYPEYTGTIARELLKLERVPPLDALNALLAQRGLQASIPLGFDNSYGIGVRRDDAARLGLTTIGDLARHPDLRLALTQEFLGRQDGWPGLKAAYELPFASPRGMDHGLAFQAIHDHRVDVIDVYTTDAKIDRYDVTVLLDDRHYFPAYDAVLLHRLDFPARAPKAWAALQPLAGTIDDARMRRINGAAELDQEAFASIAARFLDGQFDGDRNSGRDGKHGEKHEGERRGDWAAAGSDGGIGSNGGAAAGANRSIGARFLERLFGDDFWRLTLEHLVLVVGSVSASILVGVPLGVLAARHRRIAHGLLAGVGVIQTIPSLALLAFLIPLTGRIGTVPAFIALVLYALLPIVRNTYTGLLGVPLGVREAGAALDLRPRQVLRLIELPMAWPTILAGIKTSAVINVGTATIAAFIGAGGYGERITTGLALNDHAILLAGAVPAAVLALLIEGGFNLLEHRSRTPTATAARDRQRPAG